MWASFLTLVASGAGFATRAASGGIWERELGLNGVQFSEIMGAGFLGFGFVILAGGVVVETLGYKKVLILAFILHLISAAMLLVAPMLFSGWRETDAASATSKVYWLLVSSVFIFSICQGFYEAVINPLIAQLYPENKTHYLNILHAGWPAGIIVGGLFAAGFMGDDAWFTAVPWHFALSTFAVIVLAYGLLAFSEKFPAAVGQSSSGSFLMLFSCFLSLPFLLLIVMHGCIGYMELGVDSLMTNLMVNLLPNSVVILVYTSFLMFILRFFAGPIVHKINPIGLLFASSLVAIIGLLWLGSEITSVVIIFVAATFYSFGKAFLWPTMLGVAGERYPQSGAVAMGAIGMAGVMGVALIGGPRIGAQQGYHTSKNLEERSAETYSRYVGTEETSRFGYTFRGLIAERKNAANSVALNEDGTVKDDSAISNASLLSEDDKTLLLEHVNTDAKLVQEANLFGGRKALASTALIPGIMAVGFLILLIYYSATGGYKVIHLDEKGKPDGERSEAKPDAD
jgi:MFS family permease